MLCYPRAPEVASFVGGARPRHPRPGTVSECDRPTGEGPRDPSKPGGRAPVVSFVGRRAGCFVSVGVGDCVGRLEQAASGTARHTPLGRNLGALGPSGAPGLTAICAVGGWRPQRGVHAARSDAAATGHFVRGGASSLGARRTGRVNGAMLPFDSPGAAGPRRRTRSPSEGASAPRSGGGGRALELGHHLRGEELH